MKQRLAQQLAFVTEIDKLKQVLRQTWLLDSSRRENDAEHSWHLALMAMVLAEYAPHAALDRFRVLKMLLIHDLVEIDAGDTFAYDDAANDGKTQREQQAAERLFALLPDDQAREFHSLWNEFETRSTPEARFANALDRLQPILHNFQTQGKAWQQHAVTARMVLDRNHQMGDGAPELWEYVQQLVGDAVERGYLRP